MEEDVIAIEITEAQIAEQRLKLQQLEESQNLARHGADGPSSSIGSNPSAGWHNPSGSFF